MIWRDTTVATALDMIIGISAETLNSGNSTSAANRTPAMGLSKMAEMAAAEPQPTSRLRWRRSMWRNPALFAPMAAPVRTLGASNPAEPPRPTERALESIWLKSSTTGMPVRRRFSARMSGLRLFAYRGPPR